MALNELMRFPDVVPLIPGTGVQFLDFAFSIDKQSDVPKDWAFFDPVDRKLHNERVPVVSRRGDEETKGQNYLPDDILIRDMAETNPKFHATYSAKYKRYRYVINNGRTINPFFRQYSWHFYADLDERAMQAAAQVIVGTQDFRSFESHWPNKATSVRTVMSLTVQRQRFCPLWFNADEMPPLTDNVGDYIWVEIVADGFLYNMVRTIVGTLVAVGRGRWDGSDVRRIIDTQDRKVAGDCAPPQGLYLVDVCYE